MKQQDLLLLLAKNMDTEKAIAEVEKAIAEYKTSKNRESLFVSTTLLYFNLLLENEPDEVTLKRIHDKDIAINILKGLTNVNNS